jgi:hypothetical protein
VTAFEQLVSSAKAHLDPFKEGTTLSEAHVGLHVQLTFPEKREDKTGN